MFKTHEMKIGQKHKSKAYGWGVVTDVTDEYTEITYYSRIVRYPSKTSTKTIETICWIISIVVISTLIYFVL